MTAACISILMWYTTVGWIPQKKNRHSLSSWCICGQVEQSPVTSIMNRCITHAWWWRQIQSSEHWKWICTDTAGSSAGLYCRMIGGLCTGKDSNFSSAALEMMFYIQCPELLLNFSSSAVFYSLTFLIFVIFRMWWCLMVLVQSWTSWENVWNHTCHRSVVPFCGDLTTNQLKCANKLLTSYQG